MSEANSSRDGETDARGDGSQRVTPSGLPHPRETNAYVRAFGPSKEAERFLQTPVPTDSDVRRQVLGELATIGYIRLYRSINCTAVEEEGGDVDEHTHFVVADSARGVILYSTSEHARYNLPDGHPDAVLGDKHMAVAAANFGAVPLPLLHLGEGLLTAWLRVVEEFVDPPTPRTAPTPTENTT